MHGTDINPYAIAICRFRLLIAAMKASGSTKIKEAPKFKFNLACGDSLLHGRRFEWQGQGIQGGLLDEEKKHVYEVEDPEKLERILGQRYHVVVGNPPYITVRDKALNQAYRDKYPTCHRKYSLGAPFTERFFDLALWPEGSLQAGFLGMITSNSFMKREFGKKLIEDFLPRKDLTHVIDTSGAYIPGHGTPTVILFARNQKPKSGCVRAVLGIRGEPGTPEKPAQGEVWSSILSLISNVGSENAYVSVVDQARDSFGSHPWSVGGGGASELKELIETGREQLASKVSIIGFGAILGEDEAFCVPSSKVRAVKFPTRSRELVEGDQVRDWSLKSVTNVLFPYDSDINFDADISQEKYLWPLRTQLWSRNTFGNKTFKEAGRGFVEYHQIPKERNKAGLCIGYGEIATHNHFVLDRGGKIFNRTAPIIKLNSDASENEYLSLLGLLNSSTACFWMKQVFHNKGDSTDSNGARVTGDPAFDTYQYAGTGLKKFPIAEDLKGQTLYFAQQIYSLVGQLKEVDPEHILSSSGSGVVEGLSHAQKQDEQFFCRMIAFQEELDWSTYQLYGLVDTALCYQGELPAVKLGERAFEIHLARKMVAGEAESSWFVRHGITPTTDVPSHWPEDYRLLFERRLQAIEQHQWIGLIEQPEYKRRWSRDSWEVRLEIALKECLLGGIEQACQATELQTCAQIADRIRHDANLIRVAELYCGSDLFDLQALVSELVEADNVPQMAAARLKPSSIPKFRAWQETWNMQRLEDAIDEKYGVGHPLSQENARDLHEKSKHELALAQAKLEKAERLGDIPLPPQYKSTDFRQPSYWPLRGKLDVPKERFFSLPGCEKGGDSTLVIGWAGLNHLQRAQAIAAWYLDRKEGEGWDAERLMPMLVALEELIPWLKQWHNEVDPEFGERMGDYYEGFLLEELRNLEITRADLLNWQPATVAGKRRRAVRLCIASAL